MSVTDKEKTAPWETAPTGSGVAQELAASGALDDLFEQVESGNVELTGADGLLPALLKEALERGLQAELTDHLGYEKGEPAKAARGNARNGTTTKTIDSEVGSFETCGPPGPGRELHAPPGA
ncbi:Transposase, Mutator family [Actinomyces ruminicola]|uniref:Transposase, Mutator family n=1 Tax=Actinomyces ruminicola TaxID=332524 RepID=A0A1G9ZWD3_9ACTO|nr:Transposase, Mutator family [Actinomyces ruminicola]